MVFIPIPVAGRSIVSYCPYCGEKLGRDLHFKVGTPEMKCRKCGCQVRTSRREWIELGVPERGSYFMFWWFPIVGIFLFLSQRRAIRSSLGRTGNSPESRRRTALALLASSPFFLMWVAFPFGLLVFALGELAGLWH